MQKLLFLTLFFTYCHLQSIAQTDSAAATSINQSSTHSYFKAGLGYLSNNVYNGRKDSLIVPYISPSLEYFHKSGLFVKASMSYLVSGYAQRVDLYQLEAGYQFEIKDNFSGSISATKPFYNSSSVSVQSETKGELDAAFSYNIAGTIAFNAGGGYISTSGKADKFFNLGLSHEFIFGDKKDWSLEPGLTSNFGTRNYYEQYKNRRVLKTGKFKKADSSVTGTGNQKVVVTSTVATVDAGKLVMMDTELSLSVYHDSRKWSFFATPTLALPVNPANYITTIATNRTLANGSFDHTSHSQRSQEKIGNTFYLEAGVTYRF